MIPLRPLRLCAGCARPIADHYRMGVLLTCQDLADLKRVPPPAPSETRLVSPEQLSNEGRF